jgi:hypothetical protein
MAQLQTLSIRAYQHHSGLKSQSSHHPRGIMYRLHFTSVVLIDAAAIDIYVHGRGCNGIGGCNGSGGG